MDLISRDAAIRKLQDKGEEPMYQHPDEDWKCGLIMAEDIINDLPTAEREGKWIKDKERSKGHIVPIFSCSNCNEMEAWGWDEVKVYRYCPNCGARMEG